MINIIKDFLTWNLYRFLGLLISMHKNVSVYVAGYMYFGKHHVQRG